MHLIRALPERLALLRRTDDLLDRIGEAFREKRHVTPAEIDALEALRNDVYDALHDRDAVAV